MRAELLWFVVLTAPAPAHPPIPPSPAPRADIPMLVRAAEHAGLRLEVLHEALQARGVSDFTQEPIENGYGIDMGIRDPFGNAIRILQPAKVGHKVTA